MSLNTLTRAVLVNISVTAYKKETEANEIWLLFPTTMLMPKSRIYTPAQAELNLDWHVPGVSRALAKDTRTGLQTRTAPSALRVHKSNKK